jgi:dTDP-glucose 4,6-dehydratase
MKILVTGGAGFIGSNFIRFTLSKYPEYKIVNLDKLTYAGNLDNLKDVASNRNYKFIKGDICDKNVVENVMKDCDAIVHFAAETHVDRSIVDAGSFVLTDVFGSYRLLEAAKKTGVERFIHISTDEIYGSIENGAFKETDKLEPRNPYSASKAGAEMLAKSYFITHGLPVIITRSSNNYGPYQHPEKFIPLFIINALKNKHLPLYGDGGNVRDWLYVIDNCEAIDVALHDGKDGETYNIGGGNERANIDVAKAILGFLGKPESLINFIEDRKGHDRRYALDSNKVRKLGWKPKSNFEEKLEDTVNWYKKNESWWKKLTL